jgi:DMSO/TMAO reductase YedYZ molybdopterin-dependent catalytic subunit
MSSLPPGQHAIDEHPRWGLPRFMGVRIAAPPSAVIEIAGDVARGARLDLAELPRYDVVADLHCVTTWTRRGLRWSGWAFRDVWERLVVPRTSPAPDARFVVVHGLDGYWTSLPLEDALAPDVLLADRLDGAPLTRAHGAPLRLVAPAHYGYKQAKHVAIVEVRRALPEGRTQVWFEHPRARVALEERGPVLPGVLYRALYRATLPLMRRGFTRATRRRTPT